jgi:hypothetical protein
MPSSPLATTQRYIAQGVRAFCWLTAVANTSAPSRAEINAGTALQGQMSDASGFTQKTDMIEAPDFGTRRVQKLPGPISVDDSSLTFYLSLTSSDVRTLLTQDLVGFLLIFLEGDVPGRKLDLWPSTIAAASKQQSRSDPAQIEIGFANTGIVVENITVPA